MAIARGTTPWLCLSLPDEYIGSPVQAAYVTVAQGETIIVNKVVNIGDDIVLNLEDKTISVHLTQEDTLALSEDQITAIQLRFIDNLNEAYATDIVTYNTYPVLLDGVIPLVEEG